MKMRNGIWSVVLMLGVPLVALGVGVHVVPWPAARAAEERHGMDGKTYDIWRRNYGRFARCVTKHDDRFIIVPFYDRRMDSTANITIPQARQLLTREHREAMFGEGSLKHTRIIRPPDAECEALAMSLRAMAVGEYGYLRSVEIVEILGPNDMIVEEAKLIDADALDKAEDADRDRLEREGYDRNAIDAYIGVTYAQRRALEERQDDRDFDEPFHLSGYATEGLKKKQRWFGPDDKGIHIALVGYEAYGESRRRQRHRMVAIDPAVVGLGVDEATFVAFLAQRGMTPPRFVELLHDELTAARERDDADRAVFAKLLPVDPEKSEED